MVDDESAIMTTADGAPAASAAVCISVVSVVY